MSLAERSMELLERRSTFNVLLVANMILALLTIWLSRHTMLSDSWSYLNLAEGILHGKYSMWWTLDDYYADTFRAPGYPLFIAAFLKVFGTWKVIPAINFVLYWVALFFSLRTIDPTHGNRAARSLFLVLLLPLMNMPYYIGQLYTEIPVLAALSIVLFHYMKPGKWTWSQMIGIGALMGFIILCKPVFLLFPVGMAVLHPLFVKRPSWIAGQLCMLLVCGLSILPYGLWNLEHHGQFRVTPIQGGGGYMHFAYWCGKMPAYQDTISLGNFTGDELIAFTPTESIPKNIAAFEAEWAEVNRSLAPLLTAKDSLMLASWDELIYLAEPTYNTVYSLEREKLLTKLAMEHMLADPWYTLSYKAYTAVRIWVVGIQKSDFIHASIAGKLQMLYATFSTGSNFLLALFLIPFAYFRSALSLRRTWPLLAAVLYVGILHVPFTIQARYTVCVRFALIALTALAITRLLQREKG